MTRFLSRRLAQSAVVLWIVTIVIFVLQHLIASGPALARAIIGPRSTSSQIHAFINEYGLNRPLPQQYLSYVYQLLHGNLGYSFKLNQSVSSIILNEAPRDVILVAPSLAFAVILAIPLGILQAVRRNHPSDYALTTISFTLYSMPSYALGLLLIAGLSVHAGLLPAEAPQATTVTGILSDPAGLVLPVATLTLVNYALFSRYLRSSAIDTLSQEYIRTAKAKGLGPLRVAARHVLRNSVVPLITLLGLLLPTILTAGLVVEFLYNFPGIGLTYYNAAQQFDYPVELGVTLLVAVVTIIGNFLADVAYGILNPQIRRAS